MDPIPVPHSVPLRYWLDWNALSELVDLHHSNHLARVGHEGVAPVSLHVHVRIVCCG